MKTWIALAASALALMPSPAVAQDDIEFVKRQIKLLEDAGIDASEMRESLKIMEADAAQAAARGAPALASALVV